MKDLLQKAFEAGANYQHNRTTPYKTDVPDFETWYEQLHKPDVIGSAARQIHFELAIEAGQICKKYPNVIIKDIPEYEAVKKLWDAMDVIERHYL